MHGNANGPMRNATSTMIAFILRHWLEILDNAKTGDDGVHNPDPFRGQPSPSAKKSGESEKEEEERERGEEEPK